MRVEFSQDITRLAACERLLVACDFDGTLAAFVDEPRLAEPAPGIMAPLLGLATCPETTCAVVSARETDDLAERMAHPQGLILAGSYGRELVTGSSISPAGYKQLHDAATMLEELAARYAGAWVERKRHAVVLHVRNVREPMAGIALSVARASLASLYGLRAIGGAQALEWCAYAPDKSLAVDALRRRVRASAVLFVGDGEADEAVFVTGQTGDLMVKVGEGETRAMHRVQGPHQVAWMLQALYEARSELMRSAHRTPDTSAEMSQQTTA